MVQLNGKYELIKNDNFKELLIALGFPEEQSKTADAARPVMEVVMEGNKISLNSSTSGSSTHSAVLIVGQEVDELLPSGLTVKSTATIKGDKMIVKYVGSKGEKGTRTYTFSDAGFTLVLEGESLPTATRTYKRL